MKKLFLALAVPALLASSLPSALAQIPSGEATDLPVLSREVPAGSETYAPSEGPAPVGVQPLPHTLGVPAPPQVWPGGPVRQRL